MSKQLMKQSGIMFIATVIANLFAYIYHIYMARALGPADYGILGSMLALLMIFAVPSGTITTVITKFVSEFKAKEQYGKINSLMFSAIKKLSRYGFLGFFIVLLLSWFIADFMKLPSITPVVIVGFSIVFAVVLPVNRGVLRGIQDFNQLGLNFSLESVARLVLGVVLVFFGLGVNGALLAYGLGYLFAFLIAFIPLKFLFDRSDNSIDISAIYKYTWPVLLTLFCMTVMVEAPTVFVKHFFSSQETGFYNVALTMARLILFVTSSVCMVMFPKVSEVYAKGEETKGILSASIFYVLTTSILVAAVFWFFPRFIIGVLFSPEYLNSVPLLQLLGVAMLPIGVNTLLVNYNLALKKTGFIPYLLAITTFEIVFILLYHLTLDNIIWILFGVNILFFLTQLVLLRRN